MALTLLHSPNQRATLNMMVKYMSQVFPYFGRADPVRGHVEAAALKTNIQSQLSMTKMFTAVAKNASGDQFYGVAKGFSTANLSGVKLPTMVVVDPDKKPPPQTPAGIIFVQHLRGFF